MKKKLDQIQRELLIKNVSEFLYEITRAKFHIRLKPG